MQSYGKSHIYCVWILCCGGIWGYGTLVLLFMKWEWCLPRIVAMKSMLGEWSKVTSIVPEKQYILKSDLAPFPCHWVHRVAGRRGCWVVNLAHLCPLGAVSADLEVNLGAWLQSLRILPIWILYVVSLTCQGIILKIKLNLIWGYILLKQFWHKFILPLVYFELCSIIVYKWTRFFWFGGCER